MSSSESIPERLIVNRRAFLNKAARSSLFGAATLATTRLYAGAILGDPLHSALSAATPPLADRYFSYVGTYTGPKSKGIFAFDYNAKTRQFTPLGVQAEVVNPSWIETDPQYRYLYAVSEIGYRAGTGAYISSFAINRKTGALSFLNKVSSRGGGPCHLAVDHIGDVLLVANYGTGSIASFAINADGSIGNSLDFAQDTGSSINPKRQSGPHCHSVVLSPDNRFLFVPDLGSDQIKIFRFDAANGQFAPNNPPFISVTPGYGPRHFTFGVGGRFAYLVCDLGSSVMAFAYNSNSGSLTHLQTHSNLPPNFTGIDYSAEIHLDKSGRFLYASNRGNNSIAAYAIDRRKGTLSLVQIAPTLGKTPRNFVFEPTGDRILVANQDSDEMRVFNVAHDTGKLTPTDVQLGVPSPACIHFVPAG
jgi:6-phosphogluconolactonase